MDNNCDGNVDEGVGNTYFADVDGDSTAFLTDCSHPSGYVDDDTDCDDSDDQSHPGAFDMPDDDIDQNCDGEDSHVTEIDDDDTPVDGDIDDPEDFDTYDLNAIAGTTYTFTITLDTLGGFQITIYDADGNVVMQWPSSNSISLAPSLSGAATPIEWTCANDGIYYVEVRGSDPADTGTYEISIASAADSDTDEDNTDDDKGSSCFIATASYEETAQPTFVSRALNFIIQLFE